MLKEQRHANTFTLRGASVDGQGLQVPFNTAAWEDIQREIYTGHGAWSQ